MENGNGNEAKEKELIAICPICKKQFRNTKDSIGKRVNNPSIRDEAGEMTAIQLQCRGWKSICKVLDVKDKRTAKRILKKMKLLQYDEKTPVLSIEAYRLREKE
jgi:hypothetical protein